MVFYTERISCHFFQNALLILSKCTLRLRLSFVSLIALKASSGSLYASQGSKQKGLISTHMSPPLHQTLPQLMQTRLAVNSACLSLSTLASRTTPIQPSCYSIQMSNEPCWLCHSHSIPSHTFRTHRYIAKGFGAGTDCLARERVCVV